MGEGAPKIEAPCSHNSNLPYSTLLSRQWAAIRTAYGLHSQASHLPLRAGRRPCDVWDSAGVSLWLCTGHRNASCQDAQPTGFLRSDPAAVCRDILKKVILYSPLRRSSWRTAGSAFRFRLYRVKYPDCWI